MTPLTGKLVGISVSESDDLARLGFLEGADGALAPDLAQLLSDLVSALVAAGAAIQYGGDLRPGGFTLELMKDAARAYRLSPPSHAEPVFVHVMAAAVWQRLAPQQLFDHVLALGSHGVARLMTPGGAHVDVCRALDGDEAEPGPVEVLADGDSSSGPLRSGEELARRLPRLDPKLDPGVSLTALRQRMAELEFARVLVGGRTDGYGKGAAHPRPGIPEEAACALERGRRVLPLAAFGGAAHDVALAMGLLDGPLVQHAVVGPNYHETLARIRAAASPPTDDLRALAVADVPATIAGMGLRLLTGGVET